MTNYELGKEARRMVSMILDAGISTAVLARRLGVDESDLMFDLRQSDETLGANYSLVASLADYVTNKDVALMARKASEESRRGR